MCEICDADLDPSAGEGGLVTFQPDGRSREWRRRAAEEPGFVGHPPDTGWFCAAHVEAAREAARTRTLGDALADFDLSGAELGTGELCERDVHDVRWVQWRMTAVEAHVLAGSLRDLVPALFDALGLGEPPKLETRTNRRWTPMDGAEPPWCPYTDSTFHEGTADDGTPVAVQVVLEHWNDDDVANAIASLSIGDLVYVSAYGDGCGGRVVDTLCLHRPTTPAIVALVSPLADR